jgi:hypothetical protein
MMNLAFGWIWITMGFLTGAALGMGFHKEQFMGGYNSWPRRLSRLNVLIALTGMMLGDLHTTTNIWVVMSWAFIIGAAAMPICCFIAARWKGAKSIFAVPVLSLTLGGVLISWIVAQAMIGGAS